MCLSRVELSSSGSFHLRISLLSVCVCTIYLLFETVTCFDFDFDVGNITFQRIIGLAMCVCASVYFVLLCLPYVLWVFLRQPNHKANKQNEKNSRWRNCVYKRRRQIECEYAHDHLIPTLWCWLKAICVPGERAALTMGIYVKSFI